MKKFLSLLLILFFTNQLEACSAFFCNANHKLLAKNFDWYSAEGYVLKNLRGTNKYAYGFRGNNTAQWISKYGSITFNQIGKEFPYGGMNEKGLVIEQLWLTNSEYQENNTAQISELEWIQYQLDNYATVEEVINNINELSIKPIATIHYIIADKNGASAVIEFIKGKVVITKKAESCQVITNSPAAISEHKFKTVKTINKKSRKSINRYCILKQSLTEHPQTFEQAFDKLNLVSEDRKTYKSYWSLVYNLDSLAVYLKTISNNNIKKINLSDFDFSENSVVEFSPINLDTFHFKNYTSKDNEVMLNSAMKMMKINIDLEKANKHQMNPSVAAVDQIFSEKHTDLTIKFISKKSKGQIFYTLTQGEENYKKYKGIKSGVIPVSSKTTQIHLYNLPKGDYALACYQDTNNDFKIDKSFLGIPKNTGFSNNKKKLFGIPPNYEDAKVSLNDPQTIQIKIK